MSKIVQLSRGDRESQDQYIGAPGELTVDSSNQDIRLHDGVVPGGRIIGNRDNNDARYQARSPELDGLLDFEPQNRGVLVRRGPADYRLRSLTATTASILVTNGNGYDGNPTVALAAEVTSDHKFSGTVTYTKQIQAQGGIKGALTGDVSGNVTGNVTGNLKGNADGNHTGKFTGDLDTSAGTIKLGDGQIVLAYLSADSRNYIQAAGVPKGSIVIWHGSVDTIPGGWFLCNGANGTPDLRGRFVVGPDSSIDLPVGQSGGAATATPKITIDQGGAHAHAGTVAGHALTIPEMPAHRHKDGVADNNTTEIFVYGSTGLDGFSSNYGINSKNGERVVAQGWTSTDGEGAEHTHALTLEQGGQHTHTGTVAEMEILPPYYALCYIMKGL